MEVAEFERLLSIGHGRAILFMQTCRDDAPFRESVLEASFHNQAVSRAFDVRGGYMYDVILATGKAERYEPDILAALLGLPDDADSYDVDQLYHLVWLFALDGSTSARDTLYEKARTNIALDDFRGAYQVVRLDGMDGYIFAAAQIGQYLLDTHPFESDSDLGYSIDYRLIDLLEAQYGKLDFLKSLEESYGDNAAIAAYIETVRTARTTHRRRRRGSSPHEWDYETLQQKFSEGMRHPWISFSTWGRNTSDENLQRAAADLDPHMDAIKLEAYLSIFRHRPFPRDPSILISLTDHPENRVKFAAFEALESISHPLVRAFAFDTIEVGRYPGLGLRLLNENFQPDDWSFIESLAVQPLEDLSEHHQLQIGVLKIVEAHPTAESITALRNIYEYGPCADCRERVVKLLLQSEALTDTMREECRWDSNSDIRDLFENGVQD